MNNDPDIRALVIELERAGVQLWAEDGRLRFRAPKGALSAERMTQLREHREALMRHFDGTAGGLVTDPANRHEPFPLTDVQSAYLLGRHDAFAYGGVACHGYFEVAFTGLDPDRLERAWQRLVDRHEMLRAVVDADGHQQILPGPQTYRVDVTDLGGADPDTVAAARAAVRAELSHKVYDPRTWPMFGLRVTRADDRDLLHFSIDLLIADYASIQLLIAELDQLYLDPNAALPPLDISFRDYLLTERTTRDSAGYEADRAWWDARLDDLPAGPELPTVAAPAAGAPRFRRWQTALDPARWAALRDLAAGRKLTPTGALLAAYAEVIGAWSRRSRFTLNLTLLNRPPSHPQIARLVGDFTSVTLLTAGPDPDEPAATRFADRATGLQRRLWENIDHRRFSGVEVLRALGRRRGPDAALMPVVFTSTVGLTEGGTGTGFTGTGELVFGVSQTPQVWIDCQVMEHHGELRISWDVREGVFPDGLVDAMFEAYADLVGRLADGSAAWDQVGPVPLPAAQALRRAAVNDTAADLPVGLLHEPVFAQAARTPQRVAVVADGRALTYAELAGRAAEVAGWLRSAGCRPADPVAVVMDKGWEQVVGVLGVLLAGGVYVPVDTNQPPARRDLMLSTAGIRLVLTQSWLDRPDAKTLDVDTLSGGPAPEAADVVPAGVGRDDAAYVIFTSGSTGTPKGVVVSHAAAANTVADVNARFGVGADDRVLGLASLGFDLSVYDIFGPLAAGGAVVLPAADRRGDPSHWAELVATRGVTVWNSVPAQLQMLHDYLAGAPDGEGRPAVTGLRLALLSGDWIPVALPDAVRRQVPGLRVVSLGGATEAAIWSIHHPVEAVDPAWPSIPYGRPLANQSFHVLDGAMRPRPDWVPGELYIGGAGLALGYLGDPARTAERFVTDPVTGQRLYRTGDIGRYHPDGTIEFLGREDSQVKIKGHRIELAEVDAALSTYPAIGAAATVVDGTGPLDRRLVAFAEPRHRPAPPEVAEATARVADAAGRAAGALAREVDGTAVRQVVEALDRAALHAMRDALRRAGDLFTDPAAVHGLADVLAAARVAPRHHRLVRRWLAALTAHGLLDAVPGGWRLGTAGAAPAGGEAPDWDRIEALATAHGHGAELIRYLRTSARHLPELLRDELDPLALLFPEGNLDVAQAAYRDNLISRYVNTGLAAALRAVAAAQPAGRPLSVLEIGAGVGGTTSDLIDAVDGHLVDYLFTDVSPFFLAEARTRFADHPWLRYGLFDLNADPRDQGYEPHSFDVLVCANVLHNSTHAGEVLERITELVRPGGWLLFIEATRDNYPLMASMEFKEGLTDFTDERAAADRTFHTGQSWRDLVAGIDAELAFCLPADDEPLSAVGQHAFGVRVKPHRDPVDPDGLDAHLRARLPGYMLPARVCTVDALPLTGNGKVDRAALAGRLAAPARSGGDDGPLDEPRTDLERRLADLWAELLGTARIGRDVDFYTLGGDSLLLSKLVGMVRDRVPEAAGHTWDQLLRQMLRTPTVGGLADWLGAADGSGPVTATDRQSPLVPLAAGTDADAPVRVLVHDGSGTLAPYRAVVPLLPGPGAVYGLAIADIESYLRHDPASLIGRLAGEYRQALAATGRTRFEVIGYCLGGLLATELARQLTESGAEVTGLRVVSSYRVPYTVEDDLVAEWAFAQLIGVDPAVLGYPDDETVLARALSTVLAATPGRIPTGAFAALDGDPALRSVGSRFRQLAGRSPADRLAALAAAAPNGPDGDEPLGTVGTAARVFRQSLDAASRHRADPYAGDITFLRQNSEIHFLPGLGADMTAYWHDICLGELRVVDIPGDHFTCLQPPYAARAATQLGGTVAPC
ncbi:amino acid adenylation domain-containing protein [Polymorphospora sp. A560]